MSEIEEDLPEQMRIRREKRAALLAKGSEAYPVAVPRTTTLLQIRNKHRDLPIDIQIPFLSHTFFFTVRAHKW